MPDAWFIPMLLLSMAGLFASLGWVGWFCFLRPDSRSRGCDGKRGAAGKAREAVDRRFSLETARKGPEMVNVEPVPASKSWFVFHVLLRRRHLGVVLAPVLAIAMTPALIFMFRQDVDLAPPIDREHRYQAAVGLVLQEQKLVPPKALPPTVFENLDEKNLSLESADRDWGRLDPVFAQLVLRVMERMQARGVRMALLEGYRSPERQEVLASREAKVTGARGGQSKHQYGLAVDLAPFQDGHLVISEADPWAARVYEIYGQEAEAVGLVWGGRWSFRDLVHIEAPGTIADNLRAAASAQR